jgi:hypothetical protein
MDYLHLMERTITTFKFGRQDLWLMQLYGAGVNKMYMFSNLSLMDEIILSICRPFAQLDTAQFSGALASKFP